MFFLFLCVQIHKILMVSDKMTHKAFKIQINNNPLEKFTFTIYQNYTCWLF